MFTFTRCDDWDQMKPGQWTPTKEAKGKSAAISCPQCGTHGGLDHDIAADGTVSPSLVCPSSSCTFHDYGKLEGWTP